MTTPDPSVQSPQPSPVQAQLPFPAAQTPQPQAGFDVESWAKSQGVDVTQFGGPEGFMKTLMQGVDQAATLQQQLDSMRQVQATTAQPAGTESNWRQYEQFLTQDASGRIIPKQGSEYAVPVGALHAANEEQTRRRETMETLLSNPQEFIQNNLGDYVQQQAQELFEKRQAEQQQQQTIENYLKENARALYTVDAQGQPTDELSPRGQRLMQIAQQYAEQNIPETQIFPLATQALESEVYREHFEQREQFGQMQQQWQQLMQNPQLQQQMHQNPQLQQQLHQLQQNPQAQQQLMQEVQRQMQAPQQANPQWSGQTNPQTPGQQPAGPLWQDQPGAVARQNPLPWQQSSPNTDFRAPSPNNGQQPPQGPSFLQEKGLPERGDAGAWNTQERLEAPDTDDNVVADPEDILQNELRQRGAAGDFN